MYIKKNLVFLKEKNNISYRKISSAININISAIIRIKNGAEDNVTIKTVTKLAKYFKLSLDDFVYKDLSKQGYDDNDEAKNDCRVNIK